MYDAQFWESRSCESSVSNANATRYANSWIMSHDHWPRFAYLAGKVHVFMENVTVWQSESWIIGAE